MMRATGFLSGSQFALKQEAGRLHRTARQTCREASARVLLKDSSDTPCAVKAAAWPSGYSLLHLGQTGLPGQAAPPRRVQSLDLVGEDRSFDRGQHLLDVHDVTD
jgi:hypothetical protein